MKSKLLGEIVVLILFLVAALAQSIFGATHSQCVACHTSPGKLIKITREIAKNQPPVHSPLSEGEG